MIEYYRPIRKLIRKRKLKGLSNAEIDELTKKLDVFFPASIFEALQIFGYHALDLNGANAAIHKNTGLLDTSRYDLIDAEFQKDYHKFVGEYPPEDYFLIDTWEQSYYYVFILLEERQPDPKVYFYQPSPNSEGYRLGAPTYSHYLLNSSLINFYRSTRR
ncbi:MAG: SMI1/KNR4 family protein [Bacteroidota bacterium]